MPPAESQIWSALVTGVRDYVGKNGFPGAIIGLSGGIAAYKAAELTRLWVQEGIDVAVSTWQRIAPNTLPAMAKVGGQYINSQLAIMEAHERGFAEAIVLSSARLRPASVAFRYATARIAAPSAPIPAADVSMPRPRESTCNNLANTGSTWMKPMARVAWSSATTMTRAKTSLARM